MPNGLIVWGHGGGYRFLSDADSTPTKADGSTVLQEQFPNSLTTGRITQALRKLWTPISGIQWLGNDTCYSTDAFNMQTLRRAGLTVIAGSPDPIPGEGNNYKKLVSSYRRMEPQSSGATFINAYPDDYTDPYAVFDLTQWHKVTDTLMEIADRMPQREVRRLIEVITKKDFGSEFVDINFLADTASPKLQRRLNNALSTTRLASRNLNDRSGAMIWFPFNEYTTNREGNLEAVEIVSNAYELPSRWKSFLRRTVDIIS